MEIRFDHGPDGVAAAFEAPERLITAFDMTEVEPALVALDTARAAGAWLAGFASYELGYALEPKLASLMPVRRRVPLLQFGVYEAPGRVPALPDTSAVLDNFSAIWDEARYVESFQTVHDHIAAGDIYQANLTFPARMSTTAPPEALYAALARLQPVRFGAFIRAQGLPAILSRSPELFFSTDGAGRIETRPMKGTQPRSDDPVEDARRRDFLREDEKNRAENLMIVDLLRNDISRICRPGSVKVPDLFRVETYTTLHQMISRITGQMEPGTKLSDIFRALFPCGSITGAPKVRAMEVIAEQEAGARDIYCGTIGWAAPDGRSEFNVAIRTLLADRGQITLNMGGGVVYDSTGPSEYEEALWKARFARQLSPAFV
ncbi:aminodeoxychorismate synthase component I [Roseovarius aestuariivivens]|uniref:aminodeoxychorismate synthase component I n=1 Tax=Roseovarius aestuariivivens TaxID=1888910 RepID=UPI0010810907|nr:aminodeoxychorismate synthase component I [Roseovarius aestuariivivens]